MQVRLYRSLIHLYIVFERSPFNSLKTKSLAVPWGHWRGLEVEGAAKFIGRTAYVLVAWQPCLRLPRGSRQCGGVWVGFAHTWGGGWCYLPLAATDTVKQKVWSLFFGVLLGGSLFFWLFHLVFWFFEGQRSTKLEPDWSDAVSSIYLFLVYKSYSKPYYMSRITSQKTNWSCFIQNWTKENSVSVHF